MPGRQGLLNMPLPHSLSNRLLRIAAEEVTPKVRAARAKRYGAKFSSGFMAFYTSAEMADCTVVGPDGREYRLHGLLLAYHSEFFRQALSSDFKEGQTKRIVLRFEDAGEIWPTLIEYFYTEEILLTDSNVLALFAASRELLIPAIQDYCADFAQSSLEASNAIQFLSQAVQYNCDQFRTSCVTLVAQSFNTCCFRPTDGLPVDVMMEILEHPQLYVQTEEQVLHFVLNYVRRHKLDDSSVRMLFSTVRLPFLSNDRLASLALAGSQRSDTRVTAGGAPDADSAAAEASAASASGRSHQGPPSDMLLAAMAQRLRMLDRPERMPPAPPQPTTGATGSGSGPGPGLGSGQGSQASGDTAGTVNSGSGPLSSSGSGATGAANGGGGGSVSGSGSSNGSRVLSGVEAGPGGSAAVAPRKTYCCSVEYGLPGGSEYVSIPMEQVWDDLAPSLSIAVSGDTVEGDSDSILRIVDDSASWFTVTSDDPCRPVWVEVTFPPYMRVVELTKYTFSHGMNMIAHMFPYGISDSSWFQMKGMSTQVSPGDDTAFTPLRTQDSCTQHTEFVVTVDPACTKQVVWRRMRLVAGEDSVDQVRLSIRKLKLYGKVEVSLMREPEGRDVVAAWRRRKEAAAAPSNRTHSMLRGLSAKRLDQF